MNLSADQLFMRAEARRLLATQAGSAQLRKAIEAGGFDRDLWKSVAGELGWCAVAIPESAGGLGLGVMELVLLAEEAGRRLAPIPFWSTACLAAPMIAALAGDRRDELLGRIAGGAATAVALDLGAVEPVPTIRASAGGEGYVLDGSVVAADLPSAEIVLVPADIGGDLALFVLEAGEQVRALHSLDLTRPFGRLQLDGHRVPASARIDDGEGLDRARLAEGLSQPLLTTKLGLAAEQVGAAQGALDLTLAYISERVQFGRTIASFQAVKHRCAALVVDIAEARSLLYGAAAGLDAGSPEAELEITAAGVLATEALFRAAEEAIQLHGGVGNTWEYDPHLYLRRAQASAALFGAAEDRLETIAARLLGAAA
jgi:alkylation response protein AidB-like acyl-CoA dehydrogenase